jgi:hypothetical protein
MPQVTWDQSYTYYRLAVNLNETFYDYYDADPKVPTLYQNVASGDVFDNTTALKVSTHACASRSATASCRRDI